MRPRTRFQGLVLVASTLLSGLGQAQQPPAPVPEDGAKRFILTPFGSMPFECLTNEDGLPAREVSAITQDRAGFLWFGTQDGVAQYDGYKMTAFRFDSSDRERSLLNPLVTSLAADDQGHVYIGTDGGLDVYDVRSHKLAHHVADPSDPNRLSSKKVTAVIVDAKGAVWIGTDGGLNRFDPKSQTFSRVAATPPEPEAQQSKDVLALFEDRRGHLWIGTFAGVSDYDPGSGTSKHYANDPKDPKTISGGGVVAVAEDAEGSIWIGTPGEGVNRIDPKTGKIDRFRSDPNDATTLSHDDVLAIRADRDGNLWIGTNGGGISRVDAKTKKFTRIPPAEDIPLGLPRPRVMSVYQDRGGVMWFGTFGGGVCKLDPFRLNFPLYLTKPGTGPMAQDSKGVLYLGSFDGLHRFDRATGSVKSFRHDPNDPTGIAGTTAWPLLMDKNGLLWVSVIDVGVERFDPRSQTFHHYLVDPENPKGLRTGIVFAGIEDSLSRLWLATWGAGLAYLDRSNDTFIYFDTGGGNDKSRISSDFVYVVLEDRSKPGVLWVGTDNGLNLFDTEHRTFTQYTTPPEGEGATSFDVQSLHQDATGLIWVGTHSHGLLKFNPASAKFERFEAGPTAPIYGILDDAKGRLWLTTTNGLFLIDPAAGTSFRFGVNDGLQGLEFVQNAFYKNAKTGELFVGGPSGLNAFQPDKVRLDDYSPPIAVRSFQILGKDVDLASRTGSDGALELSYFDRMVSVEFSALSFGAPSKQRYMYRLKGLHDDWIDAPTRMVSYSNLAGGDYVLEVKAANRHGKWNEQGLALKIRVDPAPWKTWWAYLSYSVLGLGIVAFYVRSQRKRVKNLENENRLKLVEKDLELMSAVQLWFLPRTDRMEERQLRFKAFYRSAEACSGDWWWYERLPDGSLWILVGDVTGHGAAPAVLTAAIATACRIQRSSPVPMAIGERLQHLNQQIVEVCEGRYFLALSSIIIPPSADSIQALTAGGLPPIVARRGGQIEPMRSAPSTPLGNEPLTISETTRPLVPGDRLLLLTDGIIEAEGQDGSQFGLRRLRHVLEELKDYELESAAELLVARVDEFRGRRAQSDDMTFVLLELPQ